MILVPSGLRAYISQLAHNHDAFRRDKAQSGVVNQLDDDPAHRQASPPNQQRDAITQKQQAKKEQEDPAGYS